MNPKKIVLLSAVAFLVGAVSVVSYRVNPANGTVDMSDNRADVAQSSQADIAQTSQVAIASGTFVAVEQPTMGTARIIQEGGHRYLELDAAFSTSSQGPDLHVLLDTVSTPPGSYPDQGRTINLGGLMNYTGPQRYPIPDTVDISSYQAVVIWCRMANATFGYASLQGMGRASVR